MKEFKGYLTVSQFAEKAHVTVQAIHKAMKSGRKKIRKYVRVGPIYLIHESHLRDYKKSEDFKKT